MNYFSRNTMAVSIAAALLCTVVAAQSSRPPRDASNLASENDAVSGWQVWLEESGRANVFEFSSDSTTPGHFHDFATGLAVPGDFTSVGPGDFLFAGKGFSGDGLVERWALSNGSFVLQDTRAFPGCDMSGVTYDASAGMLYLLDSVQRVIRRAPWQQQSPLSSAVFADWVTQSALPDLANAESRCLRFFPGGKVAASPRVFLFNPDSPSTAQSGEMLTTDPAPTSAPFSWSATYDYSIDLATWRVQIDELTASEGNSWVSVYGSPGSTLEVVNVLTAQALGSATVPPGSSSAIVGLSSPLSIGSQYTGRLLGSSATPGFDIITVRRYGFPESLSNGCSLKRMFGPRSAYVGNGDFVVRMGVTRQPAPATSLQFSGWMAVAFRANGQDPITPYGTNQLLVTDILVPASGYLIHEMLDVSSTAGDGIISAPLPIPSQDALADGVVLVQFWIADAGMYRLSEIVGFKVAPPESSLALSTSSSSGFARAHSFDVWIDNLVTQGRAVRDSSVIMRILSGSRGR